MLLFLYYLQKRIKLFQPLVICGLAIPYSLGMAQLDHPSRWAGLPYSIPLNSEQYTASDQNIYYNLPSDAALDFAITDPDNRLPTDFKTIPGTEMAVEFWLKIYSQYTSHQIVIFDEKHPEIIYEIMDFRELSKTARNRIVYEIVRDKRINKRVAEYKFAFDKLIRSKRSNAKKSEVEERILSAIKRSRHRHHSIAFFKSGLRTQTGQRDHFFQGLARAAPYLERMETIFNSHDIPPLLTRLSIVESSFNFKATSKAGASGVWQFMPASAKEFMTLDHAHGIDERLSPLKSTAAAAKLLKRNYKIMKSWPLAVVAYNSGHSGIVKIPVHLRTNKHLKNVMDLCSSNRYLGWAGKNYYTEFTAALYVDAYREELFGPVSNGEFSPIKFVRVNGSTTKLAQIAKAYGLQVSTFLLMNPDLSPSVKSLPIGFWIAVPNTGNHEDDLAALFLRRHKIFVASRR
jgi:membrane-bound lytic murein transglycosylase D